MKGALVGFLENSCGYNEGAILKPFCRISRFFQPGESLVRAIDGCRAFGKS
jgi:hypothetical protein